MRERWFERLLGPDREEQPSSAHMGYIRRLSPLDSTYTKERATEVCLATLSALGFDLAADSNIRLDLDDRPQKSPRACVIASDPPSVVHLITRAQGGLHDYQAFMHEAGHALHYAGVDPNLPYTFRRHLSRSCADRDLLVHLRGDHARAGVARRALRAVGRGGPRQRRGDDLPRGAPVPALHGEAPVRAGLLVGLRVTGARERRLLAEAHGGDRHPLSARWPISPTWIPASTPPTTSAPGSATRSSARISSKRSERTGGVARRRESILRERSSPRGRGRRARRSPAGSASTRTTPPRSSRS